MPSHLHASFSLPADVFAQGACRGLRNKHMQHKMFSLTGSVMLQWFHQKHVSILLAKTYRTKAKSASFYAMAMALARPAEAHCTTFVHAVTGYPGEPAGSHLHKVRAAAAAHTGHREEQERSGSLLVAQPAAEPCSQHHPASLAPVAGQESCCQIWQRCRGGLPRLIFQFKLMA